MKLTVVTTKPGVEFAVILPARNLHSFGIFASGRL